jgi:hypothetical protein
MELSRQRLRRVTYLAVRRAVHAHMYGRLEQLVLYGNSTQVLQGMPYYGAGLGEFIP